MFCDDINDSRFRQIDNSFESENDTEMKTVSGYLKVSGIADKKCFLKTITFCRVSNGFYGNL